MSTTTTTFNHHLRNILSYDGNVMLAAIIALLVVILFVLLLHVYAKWFLSTARQRIPTSTIPHVLTTRFHSSFTLDTSLLLPSKGLDSSVIASLPLFVYKKDEYKPECVVCLSVFEEEEVGRKLPNCCHVFHVECIDMWLYSHSTCPICRDPVISEDSNDKRSETVTVNGESVLEINVVQVPSTGNENAVVENGGSLSASSSSSQTLALSGSLKRMMSKNRSENKIHPSSNVNSFNTQQTLDERM